MKLFRNQVQTILIMVIMASAFIACIGKKQAAESPAAVQDSSQKYLMQSPIAHNEYKSLIAARDSAFEIKRAVKFVKPGFIKSYISVSEFKKYLDHNRIPSVHDSIRIYPGFENDTVFLIMCLQYNNSINESSYIKLNQSSYDSISPLPRIEDGIAYKQCSAAHLNFVRSVYIYRQAQTNQDTIRWSRLYAIHDIDSLIQQNADTFNLDSNTLQIAFESGYVNVANAGPLSRRVNDTDFKKHQGFTCIMSVYDSLGNALLNVNKPFNNSKDYRGLFLEVGNPCPPRCGQIHNLE